VVEGLGSSGRSGAVDGDSEAAGRSGCSGMAGAGAVAAGEDAAVTPGATVSATGRWPSAGPAERVVAERVVAERVVAERVVAERVVAERVVAEGVVAEGVVALGRRPGRAGRAPSAPDPPAMASRSLRATGASTVEDGDLTYSPRSCSLLRTCLLVTPSSFASSCTRALPATGLLLITRPGGASRSTSDLRSQHVHGAIFTAGS
jgi:hypothetical protein